MQMERLQDSLAESVAVREKWPSNTTKEVAMDIFASEAAERAIPQ